MKIAVIGAGAIGSIVAGYLKLKGKDVSLTGHPDSVRAIKESGLEISGTRGNFNVQIDAWEKLTAKPDLAILTTKTQDVHTAIRDNLDLLKDSLILTTQNSIQADNIVAKYVPEENTVSSIVMFGATYLEPGKVVHNFDGKWIIGKNDASATKLDQICDPVGWEGVLKVEAILNTAFSLVVREDIKGMKYLKIFVNANNCIPAILGVSMQEAFSDLEISRISIGIWKEGLDVTAKSGVKLVSLPDFPLDRLTKLTSMPIVEAAKTFSQIMTNLSKQPLYGSILQSIKRGRTSEIDYINGEFVSLAKKYGISASLNEKLTEMVHQVEKTGKFLSKKELFQRLSFPAKAGNPEE